MAVDKLVDSTQLDADLTSIANAIRTKGGTSAPLAFPSEFVSAVNAISTGQPLSFGLLAEITVTEPVYSIRETLPRIAFEYGLLMVDFDLTFNQNDYFYAGFTPSGETLSDANGYMSSASNINTVLWPVALTPAKYGAEFAEENVIVYTIGLAMMRGRKYAAGTEMTDFYCKLYNSGSRMISGTVKIYGRVS